MKEICKRLSLITLACAHIIPVQANGVAVARAMLARLIKKISFEDVVYDIIRPEGGRPLRSTIALSNVVGHGADVRCHTTHALEIAKRILGWHRAAQLFPYGIAGGASMGYVAGRHHHGSRPDALSTGSPEPVATTTPEPVSQPQALSLGTEVTIPVQPSLFEGSSVRLDQTGAPIESTRVTQVVQGLAPIEPGIPEVPKTDEIIVITPQGAEPTPLVPTPLVPKPPVEAPAVHNGSFSPLRFVADHPIITGTVIVCAVAAGAWYFLHDTKNWIALNDIIHTILNNPAKQDEKTVAHNKRAALKYAGRKNSEELRAQIETFFNNITIQRGNGVLIGPKAHIAAGEINRLINL